MPLEIVYIDDNAELCTVFADLFSSSQVKVRTYTDPAAAIQAIRQSVPNLIFIDYRLQNTNGELVAQELNSPVPTFLISGEISLNVSYPFTKLLPKPYDIEMIESLIAEALKTNG